MNAWSSALPPAAEADALAAQYREQHLALRAWPVPVLRSLWSRGLLARPETLERRESPAIEKPISEMTLADLIATQNSEPLSESRRSFLQTGNGVLSLDAPLTGPENEPITLAEAVSGDFLIEIDPDENLITSDERDARRSRFVPFDQTDLVTQRQIEWERCQAQNGNIHITRLTRTASGGIGVARVSRWTPLATMQKIVAETIVDLRKRYGNDALRDWDTLQSRIDLLSEGARVNAIAHSSYEAREYERWAVRQVAHPPFSPEREDHSAYEPTANALLIPKRGRYYFLRDLTKRNAQRLFAAGAEVVTVVLPTHTRPSRRKFSHDTLWTWHQTARDANELDVTRIEGAQPRLIRP